jgi:hypothetical protein
MDRRDYGPNGFFVSEIACLAQDNHASFNGLRLIAYRDPARLVRPKH